MATKGFTLSLSKRQKGRTSSGSGDPSPPNTSSSPFQSPGQSNLFCIYRPSLESQYQKSIVPFVAKSTLLEVLSKECAKRGTTVNAYTVWDRDGKTVPTSALLDTIPDNFVVLQWNESSMYFVNYPNPFRTSH